MQEMKLYELNELQIRVSKDLLGCLESKYTELWNCYNSLVDIEKELYNDKYYINLLLMENLKVYYDRFLKICDFLVNKQDKETYFKDSEFQYHYKIEDLINFLYKEGKFIVNYLYLFNEEVSARECFPNYDNNRLNKTTVNFLISIFYFMKIICKIINYKFNYQDKLDILIETCNSYCMRSNDDIYYKYY